MLGKSAILLSIFFVTAIMAAPILQMNRAFMALSDLIPFISDRDKFMEKKHEKLIGERMAELQAAFKSAKHDALLKTDLFAPSYAIIQENISSSVQAFNQGKKDYAHWRLKAITTHCLDCHTRLPTSLTSSFQNGEFSIDHSKFENTYNLGIAQLIVRRYVDAKGSFIRTIDDHFIKKDFTGLSLPLKQLLLIETKVLKDPKNLVATFRKYSEKKGIPDEVRTTLNEWIKRLEYGSGNSFLKNGFQNEKDLDTYISKELTPLKKKSFLSDGFDVDLLIASGLLSNYIFENPASPKAPEISYWLGWSEKHLKRENFFGSGDMFLKQCIKRYPTHPMAIQCLAEYKESLEFEFSGSAGTNIPEEILNELNELEKLIKEK